MSNITLSPSMTITQVAELVEQYQEKDLFVYVCIESIQGKPVANLVREKADFSHIPPVIRRQAG